MMRQTPGRTGDWGGIRFTCDQVDECDVVIVLNHLPSALPIYCAPENVWVLMQEPYIQGVFDWMMEGHEQYAKVFTHYPINSAARGKYIRCHPAVPWHVDKSYDELKKVTLPDKLRSISWITSNLKSFQGHKIRMDFLEFLQQKDFAIDIYGRGINFIEDKWDGLAPYRYSLAIENDSRQDYWTEKVGDCFLSWTVPIYYGCTNLEDYFPAKSFIWIDINHPEKAWKIIAATFNSDDWEDRLPALEEARNLILDRYQFFPQMQNVIQSCYRKLPKRNLILQPYHGRPKHFKKIRRYLARLNKKA